MDYNCNPSGHRCNNENAPTAEQTNKQNTTNSRPINKICAHKSIYKSNGSEATINLYRGHIQHKHVSDTVFRAITPRRLAGRNHRFAGICLHLQGWIRRLYLRTSPHGAANEKTNNDIFTAARTPSLRQIPRSTNSQSTRFRRHLPCAMTNHKTRAAHHYHASRPLHRATSIQGTAPLRHALDSLWISMFWVASSPGRLGDINFLKRRDTSVNSFVSISGYFAYLLLV
jgi:hypothetical protein